MTSDERQLEESLIDKLRALNCTPCSVVRVLVEMLERDEGKGAGRVYDPACGSGGMFVQSEKFAEAHDLRSKTGDAI